MAGAGFVFRFLKPCVVAGFLGLLAACGGGGDGGGGPPTPMLSLVAGDPTRIGYADGAGADALFAGAQGLATDADGNVYVVDETNTMVRKITPAGIVTTLNLTDAFARFSAPSYLATDGAGNVYVSDSGNFTIRRIAPDGIVTTLAGRAGLAGSADGIGSDARFGDKTGGSAWDTPLTNGPGGVATDNAGNIYVADAGNFTVRRITPGGLVTTIAGSPGEWGDADGVGSAARFGVCWWRTYFSIPTPSLLCRSLTGLGADGMGNMYVADMGNMNIRRVTAAGTVSTFAGPSNRFYSCFSASPSISGCSGPTGVAADSAGNVYVASGRNTILQIAPDGSIGTFAGADLVSGSNDGDALSARFSTPFGIATDALGNVFVGDSYNFTIRKITPASIVSTVAGAAGQQGIADGGATEARFTSPRGVATDRAGNIYVADTQAHTIRKVTPSGNVSTLAGDPQVAGSNDSGSPARLSCLKRPYGIAFDADGNFYLTEAEYGTIHKVTPSGTTTTFAGRRGYNDYSDGVGKEAHFRSPAGLARDGNGNLYVADTNHHIIRKITPAGSVTTLAGTPDQSGSSDGAGAEARFKYPRGIAVDGGGNIYVADTGNQTIRKITPTGVVATLAGSPEQIGSADGIGGAARFNNPMGVVADRSGNLYVADRQNYTIRKVTPGGAVKTIAGVAGQRGFKAGELPGGLTEVSDVAMRGTSLYISFRAGVAVITDVP